MPASLAQLVGQKLLWSFQGHTPPPDFLAALQPELEFSLQAASTTFRPTGRSS